MGGLMPAQLLALTDGPSILLDKPIMLLGRDLECDIRFDSRKISRKHCCIAQVTDYLVVRDLGSTNGIRINGTRVVQGRLRAGDELTIGNYRYQVRWDEPAKPRPRPERLRPPVLPVDRDATAQSSENDPLQSCEHPIALPEDMPPIVPARPVNPLAPPAPSHHNLPSESASHHTPS
jgi:pSer/pThr/pTyr-binding forkhead associated (FHA) protein